MAGIAYGQSDAAGLPPVDLPTFDNGQAPAQTPLRIRMGNPAQPQDASGGWAPFTAGQAAPGQQQVPQMAPGGAVAAQAAPESGGWAPFQPQSQTPPQEVGTGEAALRGAAHGLTFGFYPAIAGAASGAQAALSGQGDFSTAYNQTRQSEEEAQQQAEKQHPYTYLASDIAANIPSLFIPGIGAGKAAMAATEALPRIGQAVRAGGIAGGLFGAGDQTSKGGSALDIAEGAGGGAVAGAALGGLLGSGVEGATTVARRAGSIVRGKRDADAEAQRLVLDALKGDQKQVLNVAWDRPGLSAAREAGTDVRLADFGGGNTKALMRASTNLSPEARDIVGETVGSRFQQQGDRIGRFIRSKFGSDKGADLDALKAAADKANEPAYARAYKIGSKGLWSEELQRLAGAPSVQEALFGSVKPLRDRGIISGYKLPRSNPFTQVPGKNGAIALRKDAKGNEVLPELAFWDQAVRNLNGRIGELLRSGNNTRARDIIQLKDRLTGELDRLVPAYKDARAGAAKFFKARDSLEAGANFVTDSSISDRDALKALVKMSPAERELFKRGFAGELASKIERIGDSRNVLNSIFVNNTPARRRVLIALGQEDAGRLEGLLRIEGIVDRTRRALGNSTTIQQGHDASKFAGTLAAIESVKGALNPAYLIAIPLIWAGRQTAKQIDERVFAKVAELLMSEDPAVLARGLDIAAKNPNVRTALRYASDMTGHQIVNLLGPSGVASAALTLREHLPGAGHEMPEHTPQDNYENQGQQVAPP